MASNIEQILLSKLPMAISAIEVCASVLSNALEQIPVQTFDRCGLDAYEKASTMASVMRDYSEKAKELLPILQDDFERKQQKELLDTIWCDVSASIVVTTPAPQHRSEKKGAAACSR